MNVISIVKDLNFELGQYVVVASGILDALNIRKANDIEISVTSELHKKLRESGEWEEVPAYGKIFLKRGDINIIPGLAWEDYPTTTEDAIKSATVINGVPFMNLDELCKFKKALGREKDFKDIELIREYQGKIQRLL